MNTELTLVPQAGLCNRINAIISGFALSKIHPEINIDIYWEKSKDCFADFSDLFLPIDTENIKMHPLKRFYLLPASKKNLFLPSLFRSLLFNGQYSSGTISNLPLDEWLTGKHKVYVSSTNRFCLERWYDKVGDIFRPTPDIERRIEEVTRLYNYTTVGVHIRRTDNVAAIKNSPMSMYYRERDKALADEPEALFYIASDDEEAKAELKKRYGNIVITHQWTLERNSVQGMKDAVAELYCLARTSKLIGSTNSTYSLMAQRLYQIPILNKDDILAVTNCTI